MPTSNNDDAGFVVSLSKAVDKVLRKLFRTAIARGQGKAFVAAYQRIFLGLRKDPASLGEICYRLPHLRLEVRTVVVAPLVIDFAISEEHHIVYIKGGKLLSKPKE